MAPRNARVAIGALVLTASVVVANSVSLSTGQMASAGEAPAGRKPNVVLFLTDDQRFDDLSRQSMPNVMQKIVDAGVRFNNAVVVNSWCCPSRASILTGNYSHTTGVYAIDDIYGGDAFNPASTLATWMRAGGYRTALLGKYLNTFDSTALIPPGWDRFFAIADLNYKTTNGYYDYNVNDQGVQRHYGVAETDYATDVLKGETVKFINSVPTSAPFFAYVATTAPHGPAKPAIRHETALSAKNWSRPPNTCEANVSDKPVFIQLLAPCSITATHYSRARRNIARTLLSVDELVGAVVDKVTARGQLSNTIFVFISDNGVTTYDHRLKGKEVIYEESIKVPLAIRFDALGSVAQGRIENRLAANIDLAPTITDLAGVSRPAAEGHSLRPLLTNVGPARSDVLIEHLESPPGGGDLGGPTYCAVRDTRYKYVYHRTGERELYDVSTDPYELTNRLHKPTATDTQRARTMHARLKTLCVPEPPDRTFNLP